MLAEWTIFTQVSGVQRCPRSSRQVAADDLRPVHAIVVAGRAPARASARAAPLLPLLRVLLLHTFCRCLFGDAVASLPDEFFDDDELMVGLGSAKSCKIA